MPLPLPCPVCSQNLLISRCGCTAQKMAYTWASWEKGCTFVDFLLERLRTPQNAKKRHLTPEGQQEMRRIGGWYRRRETTPWNPKEITAFNNAAPQLTDTTEEEWQLLARYVQGSQFARKGITTLLHNWGEEVSRARKWNDEHKSEPQGLHSGWK